MKEYTFRSMEELKKFLEERKDEEIELFYYGDLDTLDGNLYTIKDIEKDMDPSWFECLPSMNLRKGSLKKRRK